MSERPDPSSPRASAPLRQRPGLVALCEMLLTIDPFLLLALVLLVVAYRVLDPRPPRRVVLATGVPQGAHAAFGERCRALLAEHGIEVVLRPTQGAAENLALLRDGSQDVDLAFVQGGADGPARPKREDDEDAPAPLVSLGSPFREPVGLFYREDSARRLLGTPTLERLTQLPGWRLNVGPAGSGAPVLMDTLFRIRLRIFRWYGQPRAIEAAQGLRPVGELLAELGTLDERVGRIAVPLAYADELYALRGHVRDVRRRLLGDAEPGLAPGVGLPTAAS